MTKEERDALTRECIELENKMTRLFSDKGWDCSQAGNMGPFDITLCKDGKVYGFVETYLCRNPEHLAMLLKRKAEKINRCMAELKPEIFILTDGQSFEIYFNGNYAMTTMLPLGYEEYLGIRRMNEYASFFTEG